LSGCRGDPEADEPSTVGRDVEATSNAVVVEFPLRGEWVAVRTPAHRIPSHGTDLLGQRYAFDFVRPDHRPGLHLHPAGGLRASLFGVRTRDYYGWGQPVHAALDGVVVAAVDRVPERARVHMVRELAHALTTTVGFDPARDGVDSVAGNHVIVQGTDACAVFAHLAPGTVSVTTGQRVSAGEVIGRVGHTGNSTAPHLHFHLMDPVDPLPRASRAPSRSTWSGATAVGSGSSAASLVATNESALCPEGVPKGGDHGPAAMMFGGLGTGAVSARDSAISWPWP
jgi:Peptidase family M23